MLLVTAGCSDRQLLHYWTYVTKTASERRWEKPATNNPVQDSERVRRAPEVTKQYVH